MAYIFDCRIISPANARSIDALAIILRREGLYEDIRREIVRQVTQLLSITLHDTDGAKPGTTKSWRLVRDARNSPPTSIYICYACWPGLTYGFNVTPTAQTTLVTFTEVVNIRELFGEDSDITFDTDMHCNNVCVINNVMFKGAYKANNAPIIVPPSRVNVVIWWTKGCAYTDIMVCGDLCLWTDSCSGIKTFPGAENVQPAMFGDFTPETFGGEMTTIVKCSACNHNITYIEDKTFGGRCWEHAEANLAAN